MTGTHLKTLRTKAGWTQKNAAKLCGVSIRTWARWEAGEHRVPDTVRMVMIAKVAEQAMALVAKVTEQVRRKR